MLGMERSIRVVPLTYEAVCSLANSTNTLNINIGRSHANSYRNFIDVLLNMKSQNS